MHENFIYDLEVNFLSELKEKFRMILCILKIGFADLYLVFMVTICKIGFWYS